ncbi:MAG: 2-hydroxyacyl-CoA dehydratase [Clostridia bacterium]|nr:2-hydroxyacyl-CoA dehydratase [Clostridia bacterium]
MAEQAEKTLKDYTLLVPNMLPMHFELFEKILHNHGYNVVVLNNEGPGVVQCGLESVHNDTCYPALLVIGQMIDALKSGQYDLDNTALMITQTGGGCRASNYIHLLRKALKKQGLEQIPVISLNLSGLDKDSKLRFKITVKLIRDALAALIYGDMLLFLSNKVRPYEVKKGETDELRAYWRDHMCDEIAAGRGLSKHEINDNLEKMVKAFEAIPVRDEKRVKVGVVGEIYIKYSSLGNNHLEDFLASEGCEVMLPGLLGFMLFKFDNRVEDIHLYGGNQFKRIAIKTAMGYLTQLEDSFRGAIAKSRFDVPAAYAELREMIDGVIGKGCKMGEGWLLTAEMIELIRGGYENIVSAQPFGCLPNHIVAKGMIRKLREIYPQANIVPVDYDPGATRVNQENRIKLMLAVARERMEETTK